MSERPYEKNIRDLCREIVIYNEKARSTETSLLYLNEKNSAHWRCEKLLREIIESRCGPVSLTFKKMLDEEAEIGCPECQDIFDYANALLKKDLSGLRTIEEKYDLCGLLVKHIGKTGWKHDDIYKESFVNQKYPDEYLFISDRNTLFQIDNMIYDNVLHKKDTITIRHGYTEMPILFSESMSTGAGADFAEFISKEESKILKFLQKN